MGLSQALRNAARADIPPSVSKAFKAYAAAVPRMNHETRRDLVMYALYELGEASRDLDREGGEDIMDHAHMVMDAGHDLGLESRDMWGPIEGDRHYPPALPRGGPTTTKRRTLQHVLNTNIDMPLAQRARLLHIAKQRLAFHAARPCPPGKVRNPKTGRCVKMK